MEQAGCKHLIAAATTLLLVGNVCAWSAHRMSDKDREALFHRATKHEYLQAASFSFAKHFQNHMVLQKEPAKPNIYGFSPPNTGQIVNAELVTPTKTYTYSATVQPGSNASVGVWTIELDAQNADTPANISVTSQGTTLTLTDVIFGDVWICSGQSNMQFTVNGMSDAAAEKADVNYPNIRIITVADRESPVPLDDLIAIQQSWTRPSSDAVGDFSAVCWVYGKNIHKALGYSIGLVSSTWGGTPAEAWSSPQALAKCNKVNNLPVKQHSSLVNYAYHSFKKGERLMNPTDNSVLWNAMIHPLLKMTITGAIWYQGEADSGGDKMNRYNCTFPTMIADWRQNFNKASNGQTNPTFPFGFVQLAPNANNPSITVGFPDIRWHQTADHGYVPNANMPNTFMAVAMDLPDFNSIYGSIHPRDKKDVGDRLSLAGLAVAYGRSEVYQGPYPSKGEVTSSGLKITYGSSSTLEIRTSSGFELLCSSRWAATNISSHDTRSVTLRNVCHSGETLKGVRYAWRESPCGFKKCAVYEQVNGLPAPPFILAITTDVDGKSYFEFGHPE